MRLKEKEKKEKEKFTLKINDNKEINEKEKENLDCTNNPPGHTSRINNNETVSMNISTCIGESIKNKKNKDKEDEFKTIHFDELSTIKNNNKLIKRNKKEIFTPLPYKMVDYNDYNKENLNTENIIEKSIESNLRILPKGINEVDLTTNNIYEEVYYKQELNNEDE